MTGFKKVLKSAFPATLPVLAGFLVLGLAYGILMSSKGYGPGWSALFSSVAFCGSMQFVAITFLTGSFQPLQALLMTILVNARHLFYGLSMLDKYKGAGRLKTPLIYFMCDESFAINSAAKVPEGIQPKHFYLAVSILDWMYWVIASTLGGIVGSLININTKGLDFALTALFIVLFLEQVKTKKKLICGFIGMAAAFISLLIFGPDDMVIPAMAIILVTLLLARRGLCD